MADAKRRGIGTGAAVLAVARHRPGTTPAGSSEPSQEGQATSPSGAGIVAALRAAESEDGAQLRVLPILEVAAHPDNPRSTLGDLSGLVESLQAFGLLQPIVVVPAAALVASHPEDARFLAVSQPWVCLAGHRRLEASKAAGLQEIPGLVRADLADKASGPVTMIVENVHRANLSALDEARAYALLVDLDISQREIGRRTGVSQSHVSKRLALLTLPQQAQDALACGELTITDAVALTAAPADQQAPVFALARERNWPIASALAELRRQQSPAPATEAPTPTHTSDPPHEAAGQGAPGSAPATDTHRDALATNDLSPAQFEGPLPSQVNAAGTDQDTRDLVQNPPSPATAIAALTRTVLTGDLVNDASVGQVYHWLSAQVGDSSGDVDHWYRSILNAPLDDQIWVAWALTVAATTTDPDRSGAQTEEPL